MESAQARVQESINKLATSLDRDYLRKMQNVFIPQLYQHASSKAKKSDTASLNLFQLCRRISQLKSKYFSKSMDATNIPEITSLMYRCMASCCENEHYNMNDTQKCMDRCSLPAQQSQNFITQEIEGWQSRLSRCTMDCQDKVRDKVGQNPTEADVAKYRNDFEACAVKCVDSHIALLPNIEKRLADVLKQNMKK